MFRNWLLLRNETRAFPGRRFWLFPVLPALLLLHQNSYGETGPESNEFSWRRILETDSGTPVYVLRRTGVSDLIVFVSRSTDGQTEIGSGAHELPGLGYNLLAPGAAPPSEESDSGDSPDAEAQPPDDTIELNESDVNALIQLGADRPGFDRRILMIQGVHAAQGMQYVNSIDAASSYDGLVIIRPGDAWSGREALLTALSALPENLPILWIGSGNGAEQYYANLMYARLQNTRNVSMTRVPSLHGFSRTDRAMHKLEFNETALTHLLLWRAAVSWRTATEVFPGGCSYRPGGQSLSLSHIEVSGGPDIDFCPAFMRLYGASDLWRASSVQGKLCTYALPDTQRRMYCLY